MPATDTILKECLHAGNIPGAGTVTFHRYAIFPGIQYGLDDRPGLFNFICTREQSGITAEHIGDNSPRSIEGVWNHDQIKYELIQRDGIAKFQSLPGLLDDSGDYRVLVSYRGCKNSPRCKIPFRLQRCPGEKIHCDTQGSVAKSCVIRGDDMYMRATSPSIEHPEKELLFYFESSRRNLLGVHAFPGLTISPEKEGYQIKLHLDKGESITEAGIRREICSTDAVMVPCENPGSEQEGVESNETIMNIPIHDNGLDSLSGSVVEQSSLKRKSSPSLILMISLAFGLFLGIMYFTYAGHYKKEPVKKNKGLEGLPKVLLEDKEAYLLSEHTDEEINSEPFLQYKK